MSVKCEYCNRIAIYGYNVENKKRRCHIHKLEDMVNMNLCPNNCNKQGCYNLEGLWDYTIKIWFIFFIITQTDQFFKKLIFDEYYYQHNHRHENSNR